MADSANRERLWSTPVSGPPDFAALKRTFSTYIMIGAWSGISQSDAAEEEDARY
jgi:hypothetical protein